MSTQAAGRRQSTTGLQMELQCLRLSIETFAKDRVKRLVRHRKEIYDQPQGETATRYFTAINETFEILLRSNRTMNGYELFLEVKKSVDPSLTEQIMLKLLRKVNRSLKYEHMVAYRQSHTKP